MALPRRAGLISVACGVTIIGCGGGDFSGANGEQKHASKVGNSVNCPSPAVRSDSSVRVKTVSRRTPFVVDLASVTRNAGRVRLTVRGASTTRAVQGAFNGETFRPRPGERFVVVELAFENLGEGTVEVANSIGNVAILRAGDGKGWLRVDRTKRCSTVSPSLVHARKRLTSPEIDVGKGKGYKTAVVYAVPTRAAKLFWSVLGFRVPVEVRPAKAE